MSFELGFLRGGEKDTVPARERLTAFSRPRASPDVLPEEVLERVDELEVVDGAGGLRAILLNSG